jgi:hypothetical protein
VTIGILFTRRWGALGMALANFFLVGNLVMAWRMSRIFAADFRRLMADLLWLYLVPLPLFVAVAWMAQAGGWLRFIASFGAAAAAGGLLALRFQATFRDFFALRRRA